MKSGRPKDPGSDAREAKKKELWGEVRKKTKNDKVVGSAASGKFESQRNT